MGIRPKPDQYEALETLVSKFTETYKKMNDESVSLEERRKSVLDFEEYRQKLEAYSSATHAKVLSKDPHGLFSTEMKEAIAKIAKISEKLKEEIPKVDTEDKTGDTLCASLLDLEASGPKN